MIKLIKKVEPIVVKRAFIIGDFVSHQKYLRKHMGEVMPAEYAKRVAHAKEVILELPEIMLDMILKGEWKRRFDAYNKADWYVAAAPIEDLGVWRKAGGLPLPWTRGSLKDTAESVKHALKHNPKKLTARSFTAIPGIIKTSLSVVQKEKYLLPIAFKGGTGTKGRRGLPLMKGDLDDGCMRSVALAVSGKKKIKIYFGIPKSKKSTRR